MESSHPKTELDLLIESEAAPEIATGGADRLLKSLNPAQREAVTTIDGPLLVIAGAGSGKTRVLTTRIAYILKQRQAEPHNILAVTFTNKAAGEMRTRVSQMLGVDIQSLAISTFHSFCARLLRIEAEAINYPRNFVIYDTDDSNSLMKHCLEELGYSGAQFSPQSLLRKISNAKNSLLTADEFAEGANGYFESRAANAFKLYESRLKRAGAMDFDDLISLSVRLLRDNQQVREKYRRRFKYLMVDEYQDTNKSQYTLLKLLTDTHNNLCVVGDEDQSIYGWRGADIKNILDFEKDFPNARVVTLEENYRSTQTILDAAGAVIANNLERKAKTLRANIAGAEKVRLVFADTAEAEAEFVVDAINRLRVDCPLSEIVILYRTVAQSRAFENALITRKIPYQIIGGVSFYQLKEIKDITAYIKLIGNPSDDVAFERALKYPKRGFGETSFQKLQDFARSHSLTLFGAASVPELHSELTSRATSALLDFVKLINEFRVRAGLVTGEIRGETSHAISVDILIQELIEKVGIEQEIEREAENEIKARTRLDNLNEFVAAAIDFTQHNQEPTLIQFLEEVSLFTSVDKYRDEQDRLALMTVHAAKGLEFANVFVVGLEEGLFPLGKALDNPSEMEEERRLFYVAATRAKQILSLSSAQSRFRYGATDSAPSRFLSEIPEALMEKMDRRTMLRSSFGSGQTSGLWDQAEAPSSRRAQATGVSYEYDDEESVRPGSIVQHKVFGRGKVLSVEGRGSEMKLEVQFSGIGKKTLLARYARLKLIG